jgi:transcriptional regulator of acetoin/glycerol metabolism
VLTDASGVVIATLASNRAHERLMPIAHRVGVNLSEEAVGTTAPGVVAKSGQAAAVLGGEHFFDDVQTMYCAAAPIRDISGLVAGVFDISSEVHPFRFDAAALANLYATVLESRLLVAQSKHLLVLRLQARSALLDTPLAGLAGVDENGDLVWVNGVAAGLLGMPTGSRTGKAKAEDLFGMPPSSLLALPEDGQVLVELPNRLSIWVRCEQHPLGGRRGLFAVALPEEKPGSAMLQAPPEPSPADTSCNAEAGRPEAAMTEADPASWNALPLRARDKDYIEQTVRACGGNVSKAAKQLDVSRGLIYRRLRS